MPDFHNNEVIYFGEDYYDEDADSENQSKISDDPYAEAHRLHRQR